jgi:transcriptional regulator GlxA family with amidase domain
LLARGGLPPQALRRVREYVETHVHRNIDLETLAGTAELSVYHFARAFKQSTGVTPHGYVLQKRIERAQDMLVRTDLPLSEIALDTGFADHSHFARQFRRLTGMSPSEVRRSRH